MLIFYFLKTHIIEYVLTILFSLLIPLLSPELFQAADIGTDSKESKLRRYSKRAIFFLSTDLVVITILLLFFTILGNFISSDTLIFIISGICLWTILSIRRKSK